MSYIRFNCLGAAQDPCVCNNTYRSSFMSFISICLIGFLVELFNEHFFSRGKVFNERF